VWYIVLIDAKVPNLSTLTVFYDQQICKLFSIICSNCVLLLSLPTECGLLSHNTL